MKKVLLVLTIIIMCFVLTGCEKAVEGNKSFGEYTGIYKLKDVEIKIAHYKNTILLQMRKNDEPIGSSTIYLKDNKFEDLDCKFEFKKNALKLTTSKKDIPSGTYTRVEPYTTEEIYQEYVGDIKYKDKYNGIYQKDDYTIYTVQTSKETVRFANYNKELNTNLDTTKRDDNHFVSDFFEDVYDLKFNNETLEANFKSNNPKTSALTGTYTKKSKMKVTKIIKIFAFNDYKEE